MPRISLNPCSAYGIISLRKPVKGMGPVKLADVIWKIFEKTGSISAYMLYRELIML